MTTETLPSRTLQRQRIIIPLLFVLILALGAFLRFYQLGEAGVGNQYYAAAVKSMLQSWHNFFFVAFEPGGSVSVDKPPLGFWVQCLSAYFLGVNGFALALPNAVAGVLSIFFIYKLIRRPFGPWAGLAAALALALTPVAISAERNNTIDGLLVFVLLLAAWAFLQSVYTRKVGWLFLGVFFVGLGFNIKMLQAILPLPGLYALYFFAAKYKWWQKFLHLAAATVLLLVVSFSWAVAVDLTPPEDRPYVGGSEDNTVMELVFGHNGISRLIGGGLNRIRYDNPRPPGGQNLPYLPQGVTPPGQLPAGQQPPVGGYPLPPLPGGGQQPPVGQVPPAYPGGQQPDQPGQSGSDGVMDVGTPGTVRLFTFPLVGEIGWILPFVLGGLIVIVAVLGFKRPPTDQHAALILWAGWLLPEAIYFTYSTGIMHAYYMIMMAAPLAALFAITGWAFWQLLQKRKWLALGLLTLLAAGTIIFQAVTLTGKTSAASWAVGGAAVSLGIGLLLAAVSRPQVRLAAAGLSLVLIAVLLAPGLWSALTTFNSTPNAGLPYSGPAQEDSLGQKNGGQINEKLLTYLLENANPDGYLLATVTANQAAPFILATGRPVLTFGGFGGMDQVVDADGLAEMVAAGELRFVLNQGLEQRPEILAWLKQNCVPADIPGLPAGGPGQPEKQIILADCGK
ncbi:MAG: glycosyltransferase family 39 protein [Chloroflexi bacterium]|nr:glycosyltransferase family 39 protein [Chloroflexota bacterium]